MVHPYEDSDSSEDEVDWQDTRHDPYRAGKRLRAGPKTRQEEPSRAALQCVQCDVIHLV